MYQVTEPFEVLFRTLCLKSVGDGFGYNDQHCNTVGIPSLPALVFWIEKRNC